MAGVKTHIRKNDIVQVISGAQSGLRKAAEGAAASRGKRGKVLSVDRESGRAVVEGVNIRYRHQRVNRNPGSPSTGRVEKEMPVAISNLMLVCPKCDAATKLKVRVESREGSSKDKSTRVRVCKECGADIPEKI